MVDLLIGVGQGHHRKLRGAVGADLGDGGQLEQPGVVDSGIVMVRRAWGEVRGVIGEEVFPHQVPVHLDIDGVQLLILDNPGNRVLRIVSPEVALSGHIDIPCRVELDFHMIVVIPDVPGVGGTHVSSGIRIRPGILLVINGDGVVGIGIPRVAQVPAVVGGGVVVLLGIRGTAEAVVSAVAVINIPLVAVLRNLAEGLRSGVVVPLRILDELAACPANR